MGTSIDLSQVPVKGANAIKVVGNGLVLDALTQKPTGLQRATPFSFVGSWAGTRQELIAQITADPSGLVDDGPRLQAYIVECLRLSWPLAISGVVYTNSPVSVVAGGRRVELVNIGDGWIVGGPAMVGPVIKLANSSTGGDGTLARQAVVAVRGLQFDVSKTPFGVLNSVNCLNLSGFRQTVIDGCYFYHGTDFHSSATAGGDSAVFTTSNYVVFKYNIAMGCPDLAVYASGSSAGDVDNVSLVSIGNTFIKCANSLSIKRNYRYLKSVGDHFDRCFNCITSAPANGTGDALLCGSRVIVEGATARNIGSRFFDVRSSSSWKGSGVCSGTFGYNIDGSLVENAAVVGIAGGINCSFDVVIEVEGSTDASHSAVRIGQHTNTQTGITTQSTGNRVEVTAKGIYSGLIEASGSTNNTVELNLSGATVPYDMPSGNGSEVTLNNAGVRSVVYGNRDVTPGRWPFGQIFTTSTSISLSVVDRVVRFETAAGNLNAVMPAVAVNGDTIRIQKTGASGAGNVLVRDPTNTTTLFTITGAGQIKELSFDGTAWWPVG